MTDLATLQLAVDSTQVKEGTVALDGLTAAGARAEASTAGLGLGMKGAAAQGAAMAAAAQASARAAVDQAAGFKVATEAAQVNTLALRETLVVTRELMRGNYTRLPGSLMLLGQGAASQGGFSAYAGALLRTLGLVKQVQNAELAEEATAAASAAAGVRAAAQRAGANILAADTEKALAQAALRTATTEQEEAAATARLSAAHQAQALAAREAQVAENALAEAQGRAATAGAASAAATRTVIGGTGVGLIGLGLVAGVAYGAIKEFQDQVKDSGSLDTFAESLRLTDAQVRKLGGSVKYLSDGTREITGLTVSFGDVVHGVWQEIEREVGQSQAWDEAKSHASTAFTGILGLWDKTSAAISAGFWTLGDLAKDVFNYIGQVIGQGFYDGVNKAIDAINFLSKVAPTPFGGPLGINIPHAAPGKHIDDFGKLIQQQADANYAAALAQNHASIARVEQGALHHAHQRMQELSDGNRPKKGKKPKKAPADVYDDMSVKLDEEILSAKEKLAGTVQEQAALQLKAITVERDKAIEDAKQKLSEKKLTAGEEKKLELQINELADLKAQAVIRAEQTKLLTQAQAAQDQLFGFQTDALKFSDEMATTQAEHRKAQLDMLDIAYKQKAYDLQILLSKQKIAGDLAGQALTQAQIAQLPAEEARQRAVTLRKTQDPLQAWAQSIPHTADEINQALQSIEVKGFDGLSSAIADVVTGTKSLGSAFKDLSTQIVSEIIQMTTKMLIFRALSSVFGSAFGGGSQTFHVPQWSPSALFANGIPHAASGGSFIIGGNGGIDNNLLSVNGQPAAMVNRGEMLSVYPAGRYPANNNQVGPIEVVIGFGPAPEFAPYVQQAVAQGSAAAVKFSVDHTNKALKQLVRPRLATRR